MATELPPLDFSEDEPLPPLKFDDEDNNELPPLDFAESEEKPFVRKQVDPNTGGSTFGQYLGDMASGAGGAAASLVPLTKRERSPSFGMGGPLATTANIAGGVVRGIGGALAGFATGGPLGAAGVAVADRATMIEDEHEGGLGQALIDHPVATGSDLVLSGATAGYAPGFGPGVAGIVKPLAIDSGLAGSQAAAQTIEEGGDLGGAAKAFGKGALIGLGMSTARGAPAIKNRPLFKTKETPGKPNETAPYSEADIQARQSEIESSMTPAELYDQKMLGYKHPIGREHNYDTRGLEILDDINTRVPPPKPATPDEMTQRVSNSTDMYWQLKSAAEKASGERHGIPFDELKPVRDIVPPEPKPEPVQPTRLDAIRSPFPKPHAPNFVLSKRKEPTNVESQGKAEGQAPRPEVETPQQQQPTGIEGLGDQPSSPAPASTPGAQGAVVDFSKDPDYQAVRSKIVMKNKEADKAPVVERAKESVDKALTEVFDQERPFLLADRTAGVEGKPNSSYSSFTNLKRSIASKALGVANKGWTDDEGNVLSPSFKSIMKEVGPENIEEFSTYLVARRANEIFGRQADMPFSSASASRTSDALEAKYSEAARKYDGIMSGAMDYAERNGFLSKDQTKAIKEANVMYTPWERVDDDGNIVQATQSSTGGKNKLVVGQPLKKISEEGSRRSIANPIETSIKNITKIISAVEKNNSKRIFAELAELPGMGKWVKPVDETKLSSFATQKGDLMDVMVDGVKKKYQVNPEVAKTLQSLNPAERSSLGAAFKMFADIQRAGVTLSPAFGINNLLNDAWDQAAVSRTTSIPFANQARGAKLLLSSRGREAWKEWGESAANQAIEYGAIFSPSDLVKKMQGDIDGKILKKSWANPIGALKKAMELAESVGRVGEYDRAKQKSLKAGLGEAEARHLAVAESAGLLDFGKTGRATGIKIMRQYIPFFGANLSGLYRQGSSLKDPVKLAKMVGIVGGMEAANYMMNKDDDQYWNEPQWKRFAFWRIPTENLIGYNMWIPKGRGIINLGIASAFKTGFETLGQNDPQAAEKNANDFFRNMTVNVLPPPVKTGLEVSMGPAGFNMYTNRPIVPEKLQGVPERMQYTGRTSGVARGIASGLDAVGMEVSPMKVDHAIKGFGGTLAGDASTGSLGSFLKRNVAKPGAFGSEVQDRFYKKLDSVKKEKAADKAGIAPRVAIEDAKAMALVSEEAQALRAQLTPESTEDERRAIMLQIDSLMAPYVAMPRTYMPVDIPSK